MCDNLYQGYTYTQNEKLLDEMARHLYRSSHFSLIVSLYPADRIGVFYWFASLKAMLSKKFHNLLQPATNRLAKSEGFTFYSRIWQKKITLLGVIDTRRLLASLKALPVRADGRFFEVGLSQTFLEYGLWQDYGTGKETPQGNPGDTGRAKRRQRRKWFSTKYYASVMRTKEFMEENLGWQFCGLISSALSKDFRQNH